MEENSEAHMDTGVSSTTDDILEIQEVTGSHRNVETVVMVESIKEENVSPSQNKTVLVSKSPEKPEPVKSLPKPSPQELTIKKIIIKRDRKDIQIKAIQKSPSKPDELQKISNKDVVPTKIVPAISQNVENAVDSSSKVENKKSPSKDAAKTVQNASSTVSEVQKTPQKSPIKDSQPQEPVSTKESTKITSPSKPSPTKEQQVANKESPNKSLPVKEQLAKTPTKEQTPKSTSSKDVQYKIVPAKDSPPKTATKDSPTKPVEKEIPKMIIAKESAVKPSPAKEPPPKPSVAEAEKPATNDNKTDEIVKNKNISLLEDKEASNDSQMETNSDTSEKELNKSISRELRSLINSAKESKIISECTQLTSKTRKSRTVDSANTSLNASVEADKIQGVRRGSDNSQISNSSEKSDKTAVKRSMRSQNPEFVTKVKNFLNSVSGKSQKGEGEMSEDEVTEKPKEKEEESTPASKKKKVEEQPVSEKSNKLRTDPYCWRCHWATDPAENEKNPHPPLQCSVCPRSFHFKCLSAPEKSKINTDKSWVCPECMLILQAESSESRSPAMKKITLGMLCDLLKYALERMMEVNGVEPFTHPVDRTVFPDYDKYVVHPMDLGLMKQHINDGLYGSTEAFLADAQWILHNSIIFNTLQAKLTGGARALVRSCRVEMSEIEACPECYSAAHARRPTWFTDVCSTPHILLWAKLKGFPYWPAKGMSLNSSGLVDVRFFGAHDRAWVPARDCFLYSERDPNNFRTKRQDILDSMKEAEQHIRNISRKYGRFVYPPFKTQFDATKLYEQLKMMIPTFEGEVRSAIKDKPANTSPALKDKSRSNSKSSKGSFNDGDTSEGEETAVTSRKMADGAVIAREEEDFSVEKEKEKDKPMEVDPVPAKEKDQDGSRKRRRSDLEEAVITIIDSSREKRKRTESADKKKDDKKDKETNKETPEPKDRKAKETTKTKENEPSTSTSGTSESPKVTPIRLISISKVMKGAKSTPNMAIVKDDATPQKQKVKPEKAVQEKSDKPDKDKGKEKDTPQEDKKQKRRNSKQRTSTNSDTTKTDKSAKKNDKSNDTPNKEKSKDSNSSNKSVQNEIKSPNSTEASKSKDRIQFDDDTSLAVLARETRNSAGNSGSSGLPTISSVRSLSSASSSASGKSVEVVVEATSDSSIFTPTSTDNVRNMKEAVNKLQKLRSDTEPQVGRIGVRAFARTASPEKVKEKETRPNNDVEVEIKTEPMDFDDADRHMEKMDLMNAFKLRPVNPSPNLREVRINKVVVAPVNRKGAAPTQPPTIRPRAKKTFPQPKKPEESPSRSELTSKNSMVYIPIQPPMTQAPVRGPRPIASAPSTPPTSKSSTAIAISNAASNNIVNTMTSPLVPVSLSTFSSPTPATSTASAVQVPTVGQVPTTVHTMPLITSVNGQWTFSLQPVLSVGGGDNAPSPPMVNGLTERPLLPGAVAGVAGVSAPVLVPALPAPVPAPAPAQNANRVTTDSNAPGEPPRLQQRPTLVNPLDSSAPVGSVPPPSVVGPLTAKLNQNAVKMTDFFRALLEDSIERIEEPAAQVSALKLQLEQFKWRHQQEIDEIKHNHELTIAEMRSSFEKEKVRLVSETRRQTQLELDAAVKLAKSKQWCANCSQEAQFYCCWNTSYCDYPCQRAHWTQHHTVCTQPRHQDGNHDSAESRLQSPPENLPKTTAAPNLTVGGKQLAPSRVYTQDQAHQQKTSIIVSMVDDNTGNQTMKCVGTYKQPGVPTQMSPLILNKQIMNTEEAAKKVVTSGGYLIVGASNATNSTAITPARRTHAIQYIS